jgi:hypothetical protein
MERLRPAQCTQYLLVMLAALILARPTTAAAPSSTGFYHDSWAVIIGINDYRHPRTPKLRYAVNDARAIEEALLAQGFRRGRILTLVDQEATKARIETVLGDELRQKVGSNDRVLFFFAGHALTDQLRSGEEEGYLVPWDGDPEKLFGTAISMTALRQVSERLPAKHILYVVNACFSGYALFNRAISSNLVEEMVKRPAIQILTAGRQQDQAQERDGRGVFTSVLIRGLQGEAFGGKNWLALEELGVWLKQQVFTESNKQQLPQYGSLSGEGQFIFVKPSLSRAWRVGDEWRFRWESPRGKGTYAWVVARESTVNGLPSYIVKSGSREIVFAKGEAKLGWQEERVKGVVVERASPPSFYFVWPLEVGKTWEYAYNWENITDRQTAELVRRCTVEAIESITVPAGTFDSFRVVCRNKGGQRQFTYWYSDIIKMYVKQLSFLAYGVQTRELVSYTVR